MTSDQRLVPVPSSLPELLSPDWLSAALGIRFPGVRVTKVTPGPVISRVSTNARFHIECDGGLPDGLPANLCGKGYFSDIGWPARRAGIFEASFYRDLSVTSGIRTPRSVYAAIDPETQHGVVITEDVVAQGAEFLDSTSEYTPDLTARSLAELAKLHAATWGDPTLARAQWLDSRLESYTGMRGVADIRGNFESGTGAGVPDEVRDADRLFAAYVDLAKEAPRWSPWAVIHGDTHVNNLYLDADGRPGFVDWQVVQRAPWYMDVGYHIACVLTVDDRRRTEKDLLRHYLDALRAAGVSEVPSWNDAWLGIRRGILHGFYMWGITIKVDPAITASLLRRLGTAAADHEVFDTPSPA